MKKIIDFKKGTRGKFADKKIKIVGAVTTAKKEGESKVSRPQSKRCQPTQDS